MLQSIDNSTVNIYDTFFGKHGCQPDKVSGLYSGHNDKHISESYKFPLYIYIPQIYWKLEEKPENMKDCNDSLAFKT